MLNRVSVDDLTRQMSVAEVSQHNFFPPFVVTKIRYLLRLMDLISLSKCGDISCLALRGSLLSGLIQRGKRQRGSDLPLDDGNNRTAIDQRNLIVVLKYRMDFALIAFVKLIKSLVQAFLEAIRFQIQSERTRSVEKNTGDVMQSRDQSRD